VDGHLTAHDFEKYLPWFLQDNPSIECPKAGHALFAQAVKYKYENGSEGPIHIGDTFYMAFNKVLKTSKDFTESMIEARVIADNITQTLNKGKRWLTIEENSVKGFRNNDFLIFRNELHNSRSISILTNLHLL